MRLTRVASTGVPDLSSRIAALERLDLASLRTEWRRVVRTAPHQRFSADLLRRGIAHSLQEAAYGGLPAQTARKLAAAAGSVDPRAHPAVDVKDGTILVREWHGRTHTVRVLTSGFEYDGQCYRSLTKIAHTITGAAWSGPRFFGVTTGGTAFRARTDHHA
jgi:hypothetical protein